MSPRPAPVTGPIVLHYVTLPRRRNANTPPQHLRAAEGDKSRPTLCGWDSTHATPVRGEATKPCAACASLSTSLSCVIEVAP